eukprot:gene893-9804_t
MSEQPLKRTLVFEDSPNPYEDEYIMTPTKEKSDHENRLLEEFIQQNLSPPPKMDNLTPNQNKKRKYEEQYEESLNLKEAQITKFKDEIEQLQYQLAVKDKKIQEITYKFEFIKDNQEKQNEETKNKIAQEKEEELKKQYESKIQILENELQTTKSNSKNIKETCEYEQKHIQNENSILKKENEKLKEEIKKLEKSSFDNEIKTEKLFLELKTKKDEFLTFEKKLTETLSIRHKYELDLMKEKIDQLISKNKSLQDSQEYQKNSTDINKELKNQLNSLQEELRISKKFEIENLSLKEKIKNEIVLNDQIEVLKNEIENLKKYKKENLILIEKKENLENELNHWKSVLNEDLDPKNVKFEIEKYEREMKNLIEKNEIIEKDNIEFKNSIDDFLKNEKDYHLKLKHFEEEIKNLKLNLNSKENQLINSEKEKENLKEILNSYEIEVNLIKGKNQVDNEKSRLKILENLLKEKDEEIKKIEILKKEFNEKKSNFEIEFEKSKSEIKNLTNLNKNKEKEIIKLKKDIDNFMIEISAMEKRLGKGEFNNKTTKVLHFKMNPLTIAESKKENEDLQKLKSENQLLQIEIEKYKSVEEEKGQKFGSGIKVEELKKTIYDLEISIQRLKQVFKKKSDDFRKVIYLLFGFRVDAIQNDMYKLSSMYAEYEEDHLMFQLNGKEMNILETDFTVSLDKSVTDYLTKYHSYPTFLASVTHYLFNKQTSF